MATEVQEGKWIPVTDFLPDRSNIYVTTIMFCGSPAIDICFWDNNREEWLDYDDKVADVTAWMPIALIPYKWNLNGRGME